MRTSVAQAPEGIEQIAVGHKSLMFPKKSEKLPYLLPPGDFVQIGN
jgi:hypothetical protein